MVETLSERSSVFVRRIATKPYPHMREMLQEEVDLSRSIPSTVKIDLEVRVVLDDVKRAGEVTPGVDDDREFELACEEALLVKELVLKRTQLHSIFIVEVSTGFTDRVNVLLGVLVELEDLLDSFFDLLR